MQMLSTFCNIWTIHGTKLHSTSRHMRQKDINLFFTSWYLESFWQVYITYTIQYNFIDPHKEISIRATVMCFISKHTRQIQTGHIDKQEPHSY